MKITKLTLLMIAACLISGVPASLAGPHYANAETKRVVEAMVEAHGGLLFPAAFQTSPEADERIVGDHVILNIDISTPFEHDKAERPQMSEVYAGPLQTD